MRRVAALVAFLALSSAADAQAAECANEDKAVVPGAEVQERACLEDMTTAGTVGTNYTDVSDWASLTPTAQENPSGVPGLQIDGYFPDTSTSNTTHGYDHDAQFVIRLPDEWNGKLVITGAPGVRKQYAPDPIISDFVLAKGYAYASTDKGNSGNFFFMDGDEPGDAIAEWHRRVTELAIAAKAVVKAKYGKRAKRTYVTGISNGGYLTRWQLENRPDLYDGGVDWEGTLMDPAGANLLTYLPPALRNYPLFRATGDEAAHDAMIAAGFAPGSEFLWEDHYAIYWDLSQRSYREELDPEFDGGLPGGIPFCMSGVPSCDADYDYATRDVAHAAVAKVANTGDIGKPMLTLHGTLDALLPIAIDSDPYRRMIQAQGKAAMHRYYVIENGNHVDGRFDLFPDRIRPVQPCWVAAFDALEHWVEQGTAPPRNQFVPDERDGIDVANECTLERGPDVPGPGPPPATGADQAPAGRVTPEAVTLRVGRRRVRGRVVLPADRTAKQACGSGTVRVNVGAAVRRARLTPRCTFAARLRARRGRRVKAVWSGNRVLLGLKADPGVRAKPRSGFASSPLR